MNTNQLLDRSMRLGPRWRPRDRGAVDLDGRALPLLRAVADAQRVPVEFNARNPIGVPSASAGWYDVRRHSVHLASAAPEALAGTLAHELGHHFTPDIPKLFHHYGVPGLEVVAEAASYDVAQRLGIDNEDFTVNYVADWALYTPGDVYRLMPVIERTASGLWTAITKTAASLPLAA